MSKSTIVFILLLVCLAGLTGYNYVAKPFNRLVEPQTSSQPSPSPSPQTTSTAFDQLTPEQRVALILAVPITVQPSGQIKSDDMIWLQAHRPGIVTLFGDKISTPSATFAINQITSEYQPLLAVDHEGGSVQRLNGKGFTTLPSWQKLCLMSGADRKTALFTSANELQSVGIDIVFGPVIDLTASGSALGSRTCGSSPELVAQRSQEFVEAFSTQDILPVVKHFPGIGSVKQDLHNQTVTIAANEQELLVYQYVLSTYPDIGIMVAHVSLAGLEGQVCSLSQQCVQGLKKLFPQTIIFTDALEMESADIQASESSEPSSLADRAVAAARAGNDVLVFGRATSTKDLDAIFSSLVKQYDDDADVRTSIDQGSKKVFELLQQKK